MPSELHKHNICVNIRYAEHIILQNAKCIGSENTRCCCLECHYSECLFLVSKHKLMVMKFSEKIYARRFIFSEKFRLQLDQHVVNRGIMPMPCWQK